MSHLVRNKITQEQLFVNDDHYALTSDQFEVIMMNYSPTVKIVEPEKVEEPIQINPTLVEEKPKPEPKVGTIKRSVVSNRNSKTKNGRRATTSRSRK